MAVSVTSHPPPEPSQEEIRQLAHSYWEARGGQGGSPEQDWHAARQELLRRQASVEPAAPPDPASPGWLAG